MKDYPLFLVFGCWGAAFVTRILNFLLHCIKRQFEDVLPFVYFFLKKEQK